MKLRGHRRQRKWCWFIPGRDAGLHERKACGLRDMGDLQKADVEVVG